MNTTIFPTEPGKPSSMMRLLERITNLGQREENFNMLHILDAALNNSITPRLGVTEVLEEIIGNSNKYNRLRRLIETMIAHPLSDLPLLENNVPINAWKERWMNKAQEQNVDITDIFIVWEVIESNTLILDLMTKYCGIDSTIKMDLRSKCERELPIDPNVSRAKQLIRPIIYDANPGVCIDTRMHPLEMTQFLNALGRARGTRELVVVYGPHGSPVDDMVAVLAARLETGGFKGLQQSLLEYKRVLHVQIDELGALLGLGTSSQDVVAVLERIKEEAVRQRAILLFTQPEHLLGTNSASAIIQASLANLGGALAFAMYTLHEKIPTHQNIRDDFTLGLARTLPVRIAPYDGQQTKEFITKYYQPRWKQEGYIFTEDAFDSVIALEPGAWIAKERKTLPHLAVGLGWDTLQTALDGEDAILATARGALREFAALRQQGQVRTDLRQIYQPVLDLAEREIKQLLQKPAPEMISGNVRKLTRAHVIAQLINHNESEFQYPGFYPTN